MWRKLKHAIMLHDIRNHLSLAPYRKCNNSKSYVTSILIICCIIGRDYDRVDTTSSHDCISNLRLRIF
ncbi:CLUMA_CG013761, isoform A [Clunio marinus]|uniref:CLUMA_CG013761, isoform A n=1 Tax=Clunio marinus TaxID=568069 RepID=A0A1J1ILQ8_9DIPT|nr:CLUMA_CG013761, isoform A [Clunio marinus]